MRAKLSIGLYSVLLSAVIVFGCHLVLADTVSSGTVSQCYIAPFGRLDAVAVLGIATVLWAALYGLYSLMRKKAQGGTAGGA